VAAEEWEGLGDLQGLATVPEAQARDLDWAAEEWVVVEVPEVLEVVRALGVVARAADCGNPAACRGAVPADQEAPGVVPGEPVVPAVALGVVEALVVVGEPEPEVGRAAGDLVVVASAGPGPVAEVPTEGPVLERALVGRAEAVEVQGAVGEQGREAVPALAAPDRVEVPAAAPAAGDSEAVELGQALAEVWEVGAQGSAEPARLENG
jgi:hypothetical protein